MRFECGCPGHFIGAADCHFRRHTQVVWPTGQPYAISTVGEYRPHRGPVQSLGADDDGLYETMVFRLTTTPTPHGCGCLQTADWSDLEGRRYSTALEAQSGHQELVEKYDRMAKAQHAGRVMGAEGAEEDPS